MASLTPPRAIFVGRDEIPTRACRDKIKRWSRIPVISVGRVSQVRAAPSRRSPLSGRDANERCRAHEDLSLGILTSVQAIFRRRSSGWLSLFSSRGSRRETRARSRRSFTGGTLVVFSRVVSRPRRARVQETMANGEKEELYIRRSAKATVSAKFSSRWKRLREPRCEVRETGGGGRRGGEKLCDT